MKNCFFKTALVFLLTLPLLAFGQMPQWTQNAWRENAFPASEYYTGFVRDKLRSAAGIGNALKTLERDAQNQLAESIIMNIEGDTRSVTASSSIQSGKASAEMVITDYRQAIQTATRATTVKSEVKSYHDTETGMIYAFAAVRRADLAAYYTKQINVDLNKVEVALGTAEQLVAAGKKMSARRQCLTAKSVLEGIAYSQDLLTAVDAGAGENLLQLERAADLQRRLNQKLIDLEQSTFVYLDCQYEMKGGKNDAFRSDPGIFCDIIAQALSENECSVVDTPDEADYELTIIASTSQRSDGSGEFGLISYYANVRGSLYNRLTRKKTVDFAILNDADAYEAGKTAEVAATKAFKLPELKDKVLGKILPKIKN